MTANQGEQESRSHMGAEQQESAPRGDTAKCPGAPAQPGRRDSEPQQRGQAARPVPAAQTSGPRFPAMAVGASGHMAAVSEAPGHAGDTEAEGLPPAPPHQGGPSQSPSSARCSMRCPIRWAHHGGQEPPAPPFLRRGLPRVPAGEPAGVHMGRWAGGLFLASNNTLHGCLILGAAQTALTAPP